MNWQAAGIVFFAILTFASLVGVAVSWLQRRERREWRSRMASCRRRIHVQLPPAHQVGRSVYDEFHGWRK